MARQKMKCLVFGVGSVGAWIVHDLARSGVNDITIVDDDVVEQRNISRTPYLQDHANRKTAKVTALKGLLRAINPDVRIFPIRKNVLDMKSHDLERLVRSHDIVVVAIDTLRAVQMINAIVYPLRTVVYAGIYPAGSGGDVLVTQPGKTPCWQCIIGHISTPLLDSFRQDYGRTDGRSIPLNALGLDIRNVSVKASRIVLELLRGTRGCSVLVPGATLLLVGNWPEKDGVFIAPFQSAWAKTTRQENCFLCNARNADKNIEKIFSLSRKE